MRTAPIRGGGRPLRRARMAAIVLAAIVLVATAGYAAAGFAVAATRIAGADQTLNFVISHQNTLNKSLNEVNSTFTLLSNSSTYNPTETRAAVDQFVAGARASGTTIEQDDAALTSASSHLYDLRWLTGLSKSSLDHEAGRIGHAHRALASARIVAADYVQDGQFWESFISSEQDLESVITASADGDFASAKTSLATMKTDVDSALQLSGAPGLPPELHSTMSDFQTFVKDFGSLIDATQAGDDAGVSAATAAIQTDANKLAAYNFDQITAEISAFYKPMIDAFNSEMAQATS